MQNLLAKKLLSLSRSKKQFFAVAVDFSVAILSGFLAYYLRLDHWLWPTGNFWLPVVLSPIIALPLFIKFGFYKTIFRYAGSEAFASITRACLIYGMLYATIFAWIGVGDVPRSIGVLQPLLLFLLICVSRAVPRVIFDGSMGFLFGTDDRSRVMIYGAGAAGRQLAAAFAKSTEMRVVGYIDDDPTLHGSIMNGKRIYASESLPAILERLQATDLLFAIPSATRQRRNQIFERVRGIHVRIRTLPGLLDLAQGRVTVNDLRELDIEDLLGRDTVPPNQFLLAKCVTGKTVLVTGAGGSIGSEVCRQILESQPSRLLLLDINEFNLYTIHQELSRLVGAESATVEIVPLLASVTDEKRLSTIFEAWCPDTVYHAAAYKHVPLVEYNPVEGIRNNAIGTLMAAQVASKHGAQHFVLISTDKAVRSTSVMGASKRLAEMVLQAMADQKTCTRFSMVRFGNVLGSSGSVVPLFRSQIAKGGPVTITDKEMTRYFMTIPEAAQLVIQAGAMAAGGEVFVLNMGDPVKIIDLARSMIELSGLSVRDEGDPDGDIEIETVGLRPGEKLYEELLIGNDPAPTHHKKIMMASEDFVVWPKLSRSLSELNEAIHKNDVSECIRLLSALVPDYVNINGVADIVAAQAKNRKPSQSLTHNHLQ